MENKITSCFKWILVVLTSILSLQAPAQEITVDEGFMGDIAAETISESAADEPAPETGEIGLDDVLTQFNYFEPTARTERVLMDTADSYGANAERLLLSEDDVNSPAVLMNSAEMAPGMVMTLHNSGYMRGGMENHLPGAIVVNPYVQRLFNKYGALRQRSGIELPAEFSQLVHFVKGYIRGTADAEAERGNGITHLQLAVQVVRASFCFGNDPFMVLAKMRRETHFSRRDVSPTGAVGFSQMTGSGIREVQDQMSGNDDLSVGNARATFRQAIRCYTGLDNFEIPRGGTEAVKASLRRSWSLDLMFGQIMVKTLVSNVKASGVSNTLSAYREAFSLYNGDDTPTQAICAGRGQVPMRQEYSCDVISVFSRISAGWNNFVRTGRGQNLT